MLTLYHAPQSRSTSVITLLDELGALDKVEIKTVTITRHDGSGARDPQNPHPEGKVPYMTDGEDFIRERGAIFAYLTDRFPEAGLGPRAGEPLRGQYLSWLAFYQGVVEPVLICTYAQVDHPFFTRTFGTSAVVTARLEEALAKGPWLLGARFSAADLLMASPYLWFRDFTPESALVKDWLARVEARPAHQRSLVAQP